LRENQNGKRKVVVVMRERDGAAVTRVFKSEDHAVPTVNQIVKSGSTIYADEASSWDALHGTYDTKRINHSEAYSHDDATTNMGESFFSRLCRAEVGIHHHIRQRYLYSYAAEMAWRENNRRVSNGEQYLMGYRRGATASGFTAVEGIGSAKIAVKVVVLPTSHCLHIVQ
jgi:hypothetical protein